LESEPQEEAMTTLTRKIAVLGGAAALALGGSGVAQAKHGSDDPVKELRGGKRADDVPPHARRGADDPAGHQRGHRRHHHRHGADDPAGHR
jgi:hypothetical protein